MYPVDLLKVGLDFLAFLPRMVFPRWIGWLTFSRLACKFCTRRRAAFTRV